MITELRELWRYRELLLILVQRDLKVRYKNSVLGFGWSLLNPLVQVAILTLVLKVLMGTRSDNIHAYVFCATLPWIYFSTAVMDSTLSLITYRGLLKRVYFPREIIPLASVLANLVHFVLATVVLLAYMAGNSLFWWGVGGKLEWAIQPTALLIPIPMLGLTLLLFGLAMFLSVWTHLFMDVRFLADSGLRILYWVVPVIYYAELIAHIKGQSLYVLYMLNPLSAFIAGFQKLILPATKVTFPNDSVLVVPTMTSIHWGFLGTAILVSFLLALAGYRYFCSQKWALAERA